MLININIDFKREKRPQTSKVLGLFSLVSVKCAHSKFKFVCEFRVQILTHSCLVALYGNIEIGQRWTNWRLVAWRHQYIIGANVDLSSVRSFGIHLRSISDVILKSSVVDSGLKIIDLKLQSYFAEANAVICIGLGISWIIGVMLYIIYKLLRLICRIKQYCSLYPILGNPWLFDCLSHNTQFRPVELNDCNVITSKAGRVYLNVTRFSGKWFRRS